MSENKNGRHDGVRYAIEVYICSDATGHEACIRIGAAVPLPAVKPSINPVELLSTFGHSLPDIAPDWRFMTDAEIADYRSGG